MVSLWKGILHKNFVIYLNIICICFVFHDKLTLLQRLMLTILDAKYYMCLLLKDVLCIVLCASIWTITKITNNGTRSFRVESYVIDLSFREFRRKWGKLLLVFNLMQFCSIINVHRLHKCRIFMKRDNDFCSFDESY